MKPARRAMALCLALLSACSVSRPLPHDTATIEALPKGARIGIRTDAEKAYAIRYEELRNDTLFGYSRARNVRVPRVSIDTLRLETVSWQRTGALIGAGVFAGTVAAIVYVSTIDWQKAKHQYLW